MKNFLRSNKKVVIEDYHQGEPKEHSFGNFFHLQKTQAGLPFVRYVHKPKKKLIKISEWSLISVSGLFLLVNLGLLFYPKDTSMPYMSVGNTEVGRMSREEIVSKLDSISSGLNLSFETKGLTSTLTLEELGVSIDSQATADAVLAHRDTWYIPVASFWSAANSEPIQPIFTVDDSKVEEVAGELIASLGKEAQNSGVSLSETGDLKVQEAVAGYNYSVEDVKAEILSQVSLESNLITLRPESITPTVTTADAQALVTKYNSWADSGLGVEANDVLEYPDRGEIASWIVINSNPKKGELSLGVDDFAIASYLTSFANRVDIPPVNTYVEALDGIEQSRKEGKDGIAVDRGKSVALITRALENDVQKSISLPTYATKPQIVFANNYSPTNAGLANLLNNWLDTQSADYGIVIQEIGDDQRTASHQSNKLYVTASTYKMFLAYTILLEVDAGNYDLNDPAGYSDWTIAQCIQEMIRISTNFCAIPLGEKIGWANATQTLRNAGFTNTTIDNYSTTGIFGHKWSTARDEANFLVRLNAGELLSPASTNLLLNHMKNQIWQDAIPAGLAPGVVSADKVGFLDTYRHDVAVVYAPNGTYILAVMSQWGTQYSISTLSKEVYDYFN